MTKNWGAQQMPPLEVQSCWPGRSPCVHCRTVNAHQRLFWAKSVTTVVGRWWLQSYIRPKSAVNACPVGRLTAEIGTVSAHPTLNLEVQITVSVASAYCPSDNTFYRLCAVCVYFSMYHGAWLWGTRERVCHRYYHLHGVFTAFTAYFRIVLVIKVVLNIAVKMSVCFHCWRYRVQSVDRRSTDITVCMYDFFPIPSHDMVRLVTSRNCISNTVAVRAA
jgi:hypothetical protein